MSTVGSASSLSPANLEAPPLPPAGHAGLTHDAAHDAPAGKVDKTLNYQHVRAFVMTTNSRSLTCPAFSRRSCLSLIS